jgi:hypothetical protein
LPIKIGSSFKIIKILTEQKELAGTNKKTLIEDLSKNNFRQNFNSIKKIKYTYDNLPFI